MTTDLSVKSKDSLHGYFLIESRVSLCEVCFIRVYLSCGSCMHACTREHPKQGVKLYVCLLLEPCLNDAVGLVFSFRYIHVEAMWISHLPFPSVLLIYLFKMALMSTSEIQSMSFKKIQNRRLFSPKQRYLSKLIETKLFIGYPLIILIEDISIWSDNRHCFSQAYHKWIQNKKDVILQRIRFTFSFSWTFLYTCILNLS